MSTQAETPIFVPASAVGVQVMALIRQGLVAAGSYAAGHGWLTDASSEQVVGAVMVLVTVVWSQLAVRGTHTKLVTAADAAPNVVAQVKG